MSSTHTDSMTSPPDTTPLKSAPLLVVVGQGPLRGQHVSLEGTQLVVGRSRYSDVCLPDPHVSRIHAIIRQHAETMWLEDLGSTVGTWVNDELVTGRRALRDGDEIRFAAVITELRDRTAGQEPESPTDQHAVAVEEERPLLSDRQTEVLLYLYSGLTNPAIARRLGVTERTVKVHCQELFHRLGVSNRTAAVVAALRWGVLNADHQGSPNDGRVIVGGGQPHDRAHG